MRVLPLALVATGASAGFLSQQKLTVGQEPGSWAATCAEKGGIVTPWYDPAAGESVPVFCVAATVCKGHLGRKETKTALPVTVFNRETKLREEQKSCEEAGETACCTDVLATGTTPDCATGNAPCKLGATANFKDYAAFTQVFEAGADAFKDDCTNKTPTTDADATIATNKLAPPSL